MNNYCFIVGYCLGFCHSRGVEVDDRVSVELTDDEVNEVLKILREKGTNYFYRTDLERESPKLYKKLHGTFRHTAYIASELHWLSEELSIL